MENERWSFSKKKKKKKEKYTEIWYFLQTFWKDCLFKKRAGKLYFLYYLERWYFFPNTLYFFLGWKVRDDLSQEKRENMMFSVYMYGCYRRGVTHLCQKNQRWCDPATTNLKVTDVLDWHSRKSSGNSLYFHRDLYRRFHVLLPNQKKKKKNTERNI